MNSLDYKLSEPERKDLISCCSVSGSRQSYKLNEISPLPYGHLFYFRGNDGYGNSFVVNITDNGNGKVIDVLPKCDFAENVEYFLDKYFKKHK
jgi:hypothetical protein